MNYKQKKRKENFLRTNNPNSTKGDDIYDPVSSQQVSEERKLTPKEIDVMHYDFGFNKNLLNEICSSALKAGFTLDSGNEKLDEMILKRFENLQCKDYIIQLLENGLKDGIAFLYPITEGLNLSTGEPLELRKIKKIEDFNIFYAKDIATLERQMDKMKPFYSRIKKMTLLNPYGEVPSVLIDSSWIVPYEPYPRPDKYTTNSKTYGDSFYKSIWDLLIVKDNGIWSAGQIAYSMLLKILKISDIGKLERKLNEIGKNKYLQKKELELNTSTLALIGKDDEIQSLNFTSGLNIEQIKDYIYDEISIALRIPKSKLLGTQQGALASAKEDSNRWYEYIENFQQDQLDEILRRVIDMLYAEQGHYDVNYNITFNSIRTIDRKEEAEIEKIEAETIKINIEGLALIQRQITGVDLDMNTITNLKDKLLENIKGKLDGQE